MQTNDRELHFSMVDGDFKKFEGKWSMKSKRRHVSCFHRFFFFGDLPDYIHSSVNFIRFSATSDSV